MKTQKVAKLFIFEGLGFPIHLTNVPLVEIRGSLVPNINYNQLQKAVLLNLCHKKTPLTGNEIKFIRKYFSMTTSAFGNLFGNSHSMVIKWEKQGDSIARITPTTEVCLRLCILNFLHREASDFKELYQEINIPQLANFLNKSSKFKYVPFSIDAKKELLNVA